MHRITGLVAHPRTPGRFTGAVDGARRSVVSLETVSRLSLAEGRELSHEELAVEVKPKQDDEFTCMSCFLVHHRSQLAKEVGGLPVCTECAA